MESQWLEKVILDNSKIVPLNKEIGRGAYGRVFAVKYCQTRCAAKEIHSILLDAQVDGRKAVIQSFLQECYHCSILRHPNIVQFIGVYYDKSNGDQNNLPIMVMELMDESLASLIQKQKAIETKTKLSILHDVSLGLSYLHSQSQPIAHRDLSSNNVLLTTHLVAKISDLGIARVLKTNTSSRKTRSKLTQAPGTLDFMAPETLYDDPVYSTSIDVFSFAGIALHLFCGEWPSPTQPTQMDKTGKLVAFTEAERRQKYFDKISAKGKTGTTLKALVKSCLDNNPLHRPPMDIVSEKIEDMKVNESDSSQTNKTAKEKPPVQRRTVFRTASTETESLVSSPPPYQRSESLPRSTSPSHVYNDVTASLPRNFDATRYQESWSNGSCHTDCTASPPIASKRSNVKPPVPKPRSGSLNAATIAAATAAAANAAADDDDVYVNLHKSLTLNSCPPKVLLL